MYVLHLEADRRSSRPRYAHNAQPAYAFNNSATSVPSADIQCTSLSNFNTPGQCAADFLRSLFRRSDTGSSVRREPKCTNVNHRRVKFLFSISDVFFLEASGGTLAIICPKHVDAVEFFTLLLAVLGKRSISLALKFHSENNTDVFFLLLDSRGQQGP